jgi:hypothetical protein
MSTITTDSTGTTGLNQNLPPFHALPFIMKLASGTIITPPAPPAPPTSPTYAFGPLPTSINESSSLTVTVNTTNVPNGSTCYWGIGTASPGAISSSDFGITGPLTGTFIINSNTGSFTLNLIADNLTEGTEQFVININGISNTPVLQSGYISVIDTSQAPAAPTSVTLTMTVGGYSSSGTGAVGQTGYNSMGGSSYAFGSLSPTTSSLWTGNIIALQHSFDDASGADGGYNDIELVFDTAQSYTGRYTIEIVGGLTVSVSGVSGNTNFSEPTGHDGTGPFVFGLSGTKTLKISKTSF